MNKPQFESLDQMAEATAAALSQACAHSAFELFQKCTLQAGSRVRKDQSGGAGQDL